MYTQKCLRLIELHQKIGKEQKNCLVKSAKFPTTKYDHNCYCLTSVERPTCLANFPHISTYRRKIGFASNLIEFLIMYIHEFSRIQFSKNSPDSAWKIRWLSWTTMSTWFWHVLSCRYCGWLWRISLSFLFRAADVLHSTMNSHSGRLQFDCCPASAHRERRESQAVDVKLRWVREIWCRRDIDRLRACDRFVLPCRPGIWWKGI